MTTIRVGGLLALLLLLACGERNTTALVHPTPAAAPIAPAGARSFPVQDGLAYRMNVPPAWSAEMVPAPVGSTVRMLSPASDVRVLVTAFVAPQMTDAELPNAAAQVCGALGSEVSPIAELDGLREGRGQWCLARDANVDRSRPEDYEYLLAAQIFVRGVLFNASVFSRAADDAHVRAALDLLRSIHLG
jgi:hypothetical protein